MFWKKIFKKNEDVEPSPLLNDHDQLVRDIGITKYCSIAALIVSALSYNLTDKFDKEGKTILSYPNGIEATVMGDDVDVAYTKLMLGYLCTLYGNVHSGNIKQQYNQILSFVHPAYVGTVREKLKKRSDMIIKYQTFSFTMSQSTVHPVTKQKLKRHDYLAISTPVYQARMEVNHAKYLGRIPKSKDTRYLVIDFTVENSVAYLLDIREEKISS